MIMEQNPGIIEENNVNFNENDQKTLENNEKQLVLYNPKSNILNNILKKINDDDVNAKEIVPIPVSEPIPSPDPIQSVPMSVPQVRDFTVQCAMCFKWRLIPSKEKYEMIREHIMDQPFKCEFAKEWREGISCAVATDLEQDGSRLWAIDKPSIAQPPVGWQRELKIRGEGSSKFADIYYITPTGKKLRSMVEIDRYLMENPEFVRQGTKLSQFSFQIPKPLQENYVKKRPPRANTTSGEPVQASPLSWAAPLQAGGPSHSDSFSKGSPSDTVLPAKTKARSSSSSGHSLNNDSIHNPKRFKIKGPSPPPKSAV